MLGSVCRLWYEKESSSFVAQWSLKHAKESEESDDGIEVVRCEDLSLVGVCCFVTRSGASLLFSLKGSRQFSPSYFYQEQDAARKSEYGNVVVLREPNEDDVCSVASLPCRRWKSSTRRECSSRTTTPHLPSSPERERTARDLWKVKAEMCFHATIIHSFAMKRTAILRCISTHGYLSVKSFQQ